MTSDRSPASPSPDSAAPAAWQEASAELDARLDAAQGRARQAGERFAAAFESVGIDAAARTVHCLQQRQDLRCSPNEFGTINSIQSVSVNPTAVPVDRL